MVSTQEDAAHRSGLRARATAWLAVPQRAERLCLAAILLLAAGLRLDAIDRPLIDHHSWRQCDTAAIARAFVLEDPNILHPRVEWRGATSGEVEWNFPLFSYVVSLLFRVFGEHQVVARLAAVAFSLAALGVFYALARRTLGVRVALFATAFFAVNPLAVYFGRAVMPESLLVGAALLFLLAMARFAESGATREVVLAALGLSVAGLVKLPYGFFVLPAAVLLAERRRARALLDKRLWLGGGAALLVVAAWYVHARALGARTGLSYAPIWEVGADKWGNAELLGDPSFWRTMLERAREYVAPSTTGVVFAGLVIAGLQKGRRWVLAFFLGCVGFMLLIAGGHLAHTYYQIAFVPVAALAFGLAVSAAVSAAERVDRRLPRFATLLGVLLLALSFAVTGKQSLKRMHTPRADFVALGEAVQAFTAPGDKLVATGPCCMPEAFYFARRTGWSGTHVREPEPWLTERVAEGAHAAVFVTTYATPVTDLLCQHALGKHVDGRYAEKGRGKNFVVYDLLAPAPGPKLCP